MGREGNGKRKMEGGRERLRGEEKSKKTGEKEKDAQKM